MSLTLAAGLGGIAFVLVGIALNVVYVRIGVPLPTSGKDLEAVTDAYAALGAGLRRSSAVAPVLWVCTTVFAAGLLSVLWRGGSGQGGWALVGFAGVLLQNATFTCVEALRFAMATAARHGRGAVAGLWGLSNVLFTFNQVFLALAVLGFTVAGVGGGVVPGWHAWLGYVAAGLLFVSSLAGSHNAEGANRLGLVGLIGWLGWATWIVAYSITLLRI
ncbi:MAG: hypothetical protein ACRDQ0_19110 [Pseudonocardia sp.]